MAASSQSESSTSDAAAGSPSRSAELLALLRAHDGFLITSHARPDGDAIGSSLGLMHLLHAMGKQAEVAFADPIPTIYHALPGAERLQFALPATPPRVAILLECDSIERTGFPAIPAGFTLNIDHHQSGREFADWNWIDPGACAVGAMICHFAVETGLFLPPVAATCLYTAVLTDTGSFTYPCTTSATFSLASHLLECGADACEVAQHVYFANPEAKVRILGFALSRMVVEGPVAWTCITLADMRESGAVVADCEGVVNYLVGIAGVQAAAVLREMPGPHGQPAFRTSLRSRGKLDVSVVAESFGGGGHVNASGCTLTGTREVVMAQVLSALRAALAAVPHASAEDAPS